MKILGRIFSVLVIIISITSIITALFTIVNIWRFSGPLITTLEELAYVAEIALDTANVALDKVDPLLSLLQQSMRDVQSNADDLKAGLEENDPIIDTISTLLGEDFKPKLEQAQQTFNTAHSSIKDLNAVIEGINTLPFVDIPQITEATQNLVALFDNIETAADELQTEVEKIKTGVTDLVIQPIQDEAAVVESDLEKAQQDVQNIQSDVQLAYQVVVTIKPRIPTIINALALFLTLQLLWSMIAQAALIYLSAFYIKYGRLNLFRLLGEQEPAEAKQTDPEPA